MFTIDFFELCFLAEACIPPRPIARTMFWQSLTDKYWYQMTPEERIRMWEWLNKNPGYQDQLAKKNEDVEIFEARFNPSYQYDVCVSGGETTYECFWHNGRFNIDSRRSVLEDCIVEVKDKNGASILNWEIFLNRL